MSLCVSDIISSVISVPKAPSPTSPLTFNRATSDLHLHLKVNYASHIDPLCVCICTHIKDTIFCQRVAWWWWWTAPMVNWRGSPLPITGIRVVHSWAQAFGWDPWWKAFLSISEAAFHEICQKALLNSWQLWQYWGTLHLRLSKQMASDICRCLTMTVANKSYCCSTVKFITCLCVSHTISFHFLQGVSHCIIYSHFAWKREM